MRHPCFEFSCAGAQLCIVVILQSLNLFTWVLLHHPSGQQFRFVTSAVDLSLLFWRFIGFCLHLLSESSDTTHEAILHNVVTHQLRVARQVTQIQSDLTALKSQLNTIQVQLQTLLTLHGVQIAPEAQYTSAATERGRPSGPTTSTGGRDGYGP